MRIARLAGLNDTRMHHYAMQRLRFDVFGRDIIVESTHSGWKAYFAGSDGKRRPADFPIPEHLSAEDIAGYLDDLFHENATADKPVVRPL